MSRVALLCAIVGLGASVAAAYVHYRLLFDPSYQSFCDVNTTISCTQVYLSRFSTYRGVPVAVFGGFWFAVAGLLSVAGMTARQTVRESVPGYLFVLSTIALAIILYLAYASFFILKAYCLLCLITYAAVIGLFVTSGAATSFPMTTLPRRAARDLRVLLGSPLAVTIAVLFCAGAATTLAFFPREGAVASQAAPPPASASQSSEFERVMATTPRVPMLLIVCPTCRAENVVMNAVDNAPSANRRSTPISRSCRNTRRSSPAPSSSCSRTTRSIRSAT